MTTIVDRSIFIIKLVSTQKANTSKGRRFWYSPDDEGRRYKVVTVTPALEVACICAEYKARYETGEGDICRHAQEAIDFMDEAGFKALRASFLPNLDCPKVK